MSNVTVFSDPQTTYPGPERSFCPAERYPEYRLERLSATPNRVYAAVRKTLEWAGLDREHFGTAAWNPLGQYVRPKSSVFVLCNFVLHRRAAQNELAGQAMCTHGSVVRAVVDYLLIATGPEGRITIGNAPLQRANWDSVLRQTGTAAVLGFYREAQQPVEARDLRVTVMETDLLGRVVHSEQRGSSSVVAVDLGSRSLLQAVPSPSHFRVMDYDPEQIKSCHGNARHIYLMNREPLEADVVFSIPKLKTHEKVGLTCVIKGFVGAVAEKNCLAHHRKGAPSRGGDEYPQDSLFMRSLSGIHDWVYRHAPDTLIRNAGTLVNRNLERVARRLGNIRGGAWYGNDTAWRMAVDLARIMHFADQNGKMQSTMQRRHVALMDGIVAGEGNGPLAPRPAQCGTLVFGDNAVAVDLAAAYLMGFDAARIPLLVQAAQTSDFPLSDGLAALSQDSVCFNGNPMPIADLRPILGRPFLPPKGWIGHVEAGGS